MCKITTIIEFLFNSLSRDKMASVNKLTNYSILSLFYILIVCNQSASAFSTLPIAKRSSSLSLLSTPLPRVYSSRTEIKHTNYRFSVQSQDIDQNGRVQLFMDEEKSVTFRCFYSCTNSFGGTLYIDSLENLDVLKMKPFSVILNTTSPASVLDNGTLTSFRNSSTNENILRRVFGAKISNADTILENGDTCTRDITVNLQAGIIGISSIVFNLFNVDVNRNQHILIDSTNEYAIDNKLNDSIHIDVLVVRETAIVDFAFIAIVYILEITEMLTFGCQIDLYEVQHTLKKPLAPLLGLVCQYIGMPLIAYGAAKAVATDSLASVGIFVAGICPGGGSSNIYSYLLDGDLSLSITMTTISTVLSLAMMPLWLYTLGKEFYQDYDVDIPYVDIIVALSVILLPLSVGLFINSRFPTVAKRIENITTGVVIVLAVLMIVTGVWSSLYIFKLFKLHVILIGCVLPYKGFLLGGFIAFLCKQSWSRIKTIAIETGMQNTGIAIILLFNTFPDPLGDLSSVSPIAAEVMSPIPPTVLAVAYLIRKKWCPKYKQVDLKDAEKQEQSNEHS